ncbi:MAG: DNA mismatch repair endonuclease MutL [Candidatus Heimdallarchaeota archaeon]
MSSIHILDQDTVARISAGEVIQRPASVVKELIENAIDAGATSIEIEIHKGGKDYIRVSDNGVGMSKADLEVAFRRYTTSKLEKIEDLKSLKSLGFRGEALASIAAVARIICHTRTIDEEAGWELRIEGDARKITTSGRSSGTTLIVTDLFYATPARRKFLKSDATEFGHIRSLAVTYILAYPEIAFALSHERKQILTSPSSKKRLDAIIDVYDVEVGKAMVPIDHSADGLRIHGFVSGPSTLRPTRDLQTVFINRRPIKARTINAAIDDAYRPTLSRRHPVAVLSLEIPPQKIDINVHPTKIEVHFADEEQIYRIVYDAISEGLREGAIIPSVSQKTFKKSFEEVKGASELTTPTPRSSSSQEKPVLQQQLLQSEEAEAIPPVSPKGIRVLGQFKRTFIVAMDNESVILVDQHAAHERIVLDELKHKKKRRFLRAQRLLEPFQFDVEETEEETLRENMLALKKGGFTVSKIADRRWKLESLPSICGHALSKQAFDEMISDMTLKRIPENREYEELAHLVACHSAIRAGESLTHTQMEILIRDLLAADRPFICAHGRPTMIKLTQDQLEKEFGRVI